MASEPRNRTQHPHALTHRSVPPSPSAPQQTASRNAALHLHVHVAASQSRSHASLGHRLRGGPVLGTLPDRAWKRRKCLCRSFTILRAYVRNTKSVIVAVTFLSNRSNWESTFDRIPPLGGTKGTSGCFQRSYQRCWSSRQAQTSRVSILRGNQLFDISMF